MNCDPPQPERIDLTIGSALDIFGGTGVRYADAVAFNRRQAAAGPTGLKRRLANLCHKDRDLTFMVEGHAESGPAQFQIERFLANSEEIKAGNADRTRFGDRTPDEAAPKSAPAFRRKT